MTEGMWALSSTYTKIRITSPPGGSAGDPSVDASPAPASAMVIRPPAIRPRWRPSNGARGLPTNKNWSEVRSTNNAPKARLRTRRWLPCYNRRPLDMRERFSLGLAIRAPMPNTTFCSCCRRRLRVIARKKNEGIGRRPPAANLARFVPRRRSCGRTPPFIGG